MEVEARWRQIGQFEIDIKAAGREATYRFACASTDGRTAVTQKVGLT